MRGEVQVEHLLEHNVFVRACRAFDDLHKQARHVNADAGIVDDLFEKLFFGCHCLWLDTTKLGQGIELDPNLRNLATCFTPSTIHCRHDDELLGVDVYVYVFVDVLMRLGCVDLMGMMLMMWVYNEQVMLSCSSTHTLLLQPDSVQGDYGGG